MKKKIFTYAILLISFGFIVGVFTVKEMDWHDYRIEKYGDIITFEIDGYSTFFVNAINGDKVIEFKARKHGNVFEIVCE